MATQRLSEFKKANELFQKQRYNDAVALYSKLMAEDTDFIAERAKFNYALAKKKANPTNPRKKPQRLIEQYHDFDDMLRRLFVNPVITAPFEEEDRRGLAFMDVLARNWESIALQNLTGTKVTVLMPTYNRSTTVAAAARSVLAQSHQNFELVIIDDGSTDHTAQVLTELAAEDDRIKVLSNTQNAGKSTSLNHAIREGIEGEWVAYLDSDNLWHPQFLAAMLGSIHDRPDVDVLFSGQYLYREDKKRPYAARVATYNKNLLLNRNYIDHNSFMHKTSLFEAIGTYDEQLRKAIDFEFILRAAKHATMASAPLLLTDYFLDNSDSTLTADTSTIGDLNKALESAQQMLIDPEWAKEEIEKSPLNLSAAETRHMSVVIPSYESLDDLRRCLEALNALDEREHIDVIVVDNFSAPELQDWLRENSGPLNFALKQMDGNYGFTHAVNEGIRLADPASDIILLNNDAQPINGSLDLLSRYATQLEDAGLLVPAQVLPPHTPTLNVHVPFANKAHYCDVNVSLRHDNLSQVPEVNTGDYYEVDFAPFFCCYIPRETLDRVGLLSADLGRHYRSDRLYSNTVRRIAEKKIYYIPDSRVIHGLQGSTNVLRSRPDKTQFDTMFVKNRWEPRLLAQLGFDERPWMYDMDDPSDSPL